MYRLFRRVAICIGKSPHRRGDVPFYRSQILDCQPISPQAWGCTVWEVFNGSGTPNLPTGVGMYQKEYMEKKLAEKSPHRRGDVPFPSSSFDIEAVISPQAWGCTGKLLAHSCPYRNLPTGVGMYRLNDLEGVSAPESPHRRGDVPTAEWADYPTIQISPQAWGCTI